MQFVYKLRTMEIMGLSLDFSARSHWRVAWRPMHMRRTSYRRRKKIRVMTGDGGVLVQDVQGGSDSFHGQNMLLLLFLIIIVIKDILEMWWVFAIVMIGVHKMMADHSSPYFHHTVSSHKWVKASKGSKQGSDSLQLDTQATRLNLLRSTWRRVFTMCIYIYVYIYILYIYIWIYGHQ